MQRFESEIEYYLEMFRRGDVDNTFHGLLELDTNVVPDLVEVFRKERNTDLREFLVEIIWGYREPSVIPFLGEALLDPEPCIWQEALDGFVTLASPAALAALRAARRREFPTRREKAEFSGWLEEAIEQVEGGMEEGSYHGQYRIC